MKKLIVIVLVLGLTTILAACGNDDSESAEKQDDQIQQKVEVTNAEKVDKDDAVVQINGTKINGDKYNPIYVQTKTMMGQYGQDISDLDKVKEQTINVLIQQELLKQDAKKQGIEVSKEKVQSKFDKIKEEHSDQLKDVMDQYGFTKDTYKDQLAFELTLNEYVKQEIKTSEVTNEEIQSYYDKLKEQTDKLPDLDKIKDDIKSQLKEQKQQQKLQAKLKELEENAEIKHLI